MDNTNVDLAMESLGINDSDIKEFLTELKEVEQTSKVVHIYQPADIDKNTEIEIM